MHADADFGRARDQKQDSVERTVAMVAMREKNSRRDAEDDQKHARRRDRGPFSTQALDDSPRLCADVPTFDAFDMRFSGSEKRGLARASELAKHMAAYSTIGTMRP